MLRQPDEFLSLDWAGSVQEYPRRPSRGRRVIRFAVNAFPRDIGWIEVICGSMFSGKTEELIRRIKLALYAKQKAQVFKPRLDVRYDEKLVVSHSRQRVVSTPVDRPEEIFHYLDAETKVVGIDEVQFFGPEIVPVCEALANRGVRVICAGLDQDYRGRPFEPVPHLMAIAEYVTKVHAICVVCGNPANRTQRTAPGQGRVLVGASEAYEARCRKCHVPESAEATPPQTLDLFDDGDE